MKTWELIKALQEGKYISHPDYEGGRPVRLEDTNGIYLVFENGALAGMLNAFLSPGLSESYLEFGGCHAEKWKIESIKKG